MILGLPVRDAYPKKRAPMGGLWMQIGGDRRGRLDAAAERPPRADKVCKSKKDYKVPGGEMPLSARSERFNDDQKHDADQPERRQFVNDAEKSCRMRVVVSGESRLPTGEQAVEKRQSRYQDELCPQPTRSPVDNTRRYGQH
jgi:hypothetical protein